MPPFTPARYLLLLAVFCFVLAGVATLNVDVFPVPPRAWVAWGVACWIASRLFSQPPGG